MSNKVSPLWHVRLTLWVCFGGFTAAMKCLEEAETSFNIPHFIDNISRLHPPTGKVLGITSRCAQHVLFKKLEISTRNENSSYI